MLIITLSFWIVSTLDRLSQSCQAVGVSVWCEIDNQWCENYTLSPGGFFVLIVTFIFPSSPGCRAVQPCHATRLLRPFTALLPSVPQLHPPAGFPPEHSVGLQESDSPCQPVPDGKKKSITVLWLLQLCCFLRYPDLFVTFCNSRFVIVIYFFLIWFPFLLLLKF